MILLFLVSVGCAVALLLPGTASTLASTVVSKVTDEIGDYVIDLPMIFRAPPKAAGEIGDHMLYLPILRLSSPAAPTLFGAEIAPNSAASTASTAAAAHATWVRYGVVRWDDVEPVEGQRNWAVLKSFERNLQAISAEGLSPVVVVLGAPDWAQHYPGVSCGPIAADALDNFASFMGGLVRRYSVPPYNVKYWEIGNEPDVDHRFVAPDSGFGCWGDQNDAYYGGGYYAEMLQQVYPVVKRFDPVAKIMNGGLLLDCNPDNPPVINGQAKDCSSGRFLEGILRNGGGAYLDLIAYHAYTYYAPGIEWDLEHVTWSGSGGVFAGKTDFLRGVMAQYNVNLPLLMNEGGLLCHPNQAAQTAPLICPDSTEQDPENNPGYDPYFDAQANYVIRLYSRTGAQKILGSFWYTMNGPGWRQGGLLTRSGEPRPGYVAYAFLANLLQGKSYVGQLSSGILEGYAYARRNQVVQIYWTNAQVQTSVNLPTGTVSVLNKFGQEIPHSGTTLLIGFDPVILIINR